MALQQRLEISPDGYITRQDAVGVLLPTHRFSNGVAFCSDGYPTGIEECGIGVANVHLQTQIPPKGIRLFRDRTPQDIRGKVLQAVDEFNAKFDVPGTQIVAGKTFVRLVNSYTAVTAEGVACHVLLPQWVPSVIIDSNILCSGVGLAGRLFVGCSLHLPPGGDATYFLRYYAAGPKAVFINCKLFVGDVEQTAPSITYEVITHCWGGVVVSFNATPTVKRYQVYTSLRQASWSYCDFTNLTDALAWYVDDLKAEARYRDDKIGA